MPLSVYTASVFKKPNSAATQYWSNVYHFLATNISDVRAVMDDDVIPAEIGIHSPGVLITEYRISDTDPVTDFFVTVPVGEVGVYTVGGQGLPPFLVVRADFVPEFGRAGRKFYHTYASEEQQNAGQWEPDYVDDLATILGHMMDNIGLSPCTLITPNGNELSSVRVFGTVTEHQFRRKWARRAP